MTEIPIKNSIKPWQENRRSELEKFSQHVIGKGYNVDFLFESFLHDALARPRLQWFAPAVSAEEFVLELSRNREMKNAERRELLPNDTQTEKSGLCETELDEGFRSGSFYWRIGATNTYCAKYVFSDIVKAAANQTVHP